jgi:hypothetical protein
VFVLEDCSVSVFYWLTRGFMFGRFAWGFCVCCIEIAVSLLVLGFGFVPFSARFG